MHTTNTKGITVFVHDQQPLVAQTQTHGCPHGGACEVGGRPHPHLSPAPRDVAPLPWHSFESLPPSTPTLVPTPSD